LQFRSGASTLGASFDKLFSVTSPTVSKTQKSAVAPRLGVLGPSVPANVHGPFANLLAELAFLSAVDNVVVDPAVRAQAAAMHQLLKAHRPAASYHLDRLLWLVRTATTAVLGDSLLAAREFLEGEAVRVEADPTSWLEHAQESALVACLELLGSVPAASGEDSAASRLAANQRRYEGPWLRTQPPVEQKRAAFELLGHYHLAGAMLKLAKFRVGLLDDDAQTQRESMKNAFMNVGLAYGRADHTELILVAPLIQGACLTLV
jgi:hypothetical protein